ncbi:MAG TPA: type 1 glutamine amidotransferase domain-containing protein [Acidimicrobiales bacterium]|jgi:putative intracellular protease/amidase|nr:type 1 glutamine amidotransferase domain-containing protein [Acidimicrobiales bacterium]
MATVLMPIPACDFDPTEVAVSWQVLSAAGHDVIFATPSGRSGEADDLMVTGQGLDPWGFLPGARRLTVVGRVLRANAAARAAYGSLLEDPSFRSPQHWAEARRGSYDALVLPGGHRARGMRGYLESGEVQQMAIDSFRTGRPVGAICHGVLVAARAVDPATGRSVLHGRRTTALTWALERKAWGLAMYTRFWDANYYRTYTEEPGQAYGYMSVQQEVTRALATKSDFEDVPRDAPYYRRKTSGRARDSLTDDRAAWVVRDGSYVSARWPGDVHTFARTFCDVLDA